MTGEPVPSRLRGILLLMLVAMWATLGYLLGIEPFHGIVRKIVDLSIAKLYFYGISFFILFVIVYSTRSIWSADDSVEILKVIMSAATLSPEPKAKASDELSPALLQKLAEYEIRNAALQAKVDGLSTGLDALRAQAQPELSAEQQAALAEEVKGRIAATAAGSFLDDLEIKAAQKFKKDLFELNVISTFKEARERLGGEIRALNRRGFLNLLLGVIITGIGVYLLYTYVTGPGPELPKAGEAVTDYWPRFAAHFAPRLTLVVFVEMFAYFFLRLYRTGLEEIKYYQNELTNLEARHIALVSAIEQKNPEVITEVIRKLAATERNSATQKGKATAASVEMPEGMADLTKNLADLVKQITDVAAKLAKPEKDLGAKNP